MPTAPVTDAMTMTFQLSPSPSLAADDVFVFSEGKREERITGVALDTEMYASLSIEVSKVVKGVN